VSTAHRLALHARMAAAHQAYEGRNDLVEGRPLAGWREGRRSHLCLHHPRTWRKPPARQRASLLHHLCLPLAAHHHLRARLLPRLPRYMPTRIAWEGGRAGQPPAHACLRRHNIALPHAISAFATSPSRASRAYRGARAHSAARDEAKHEHQHHVLMASKRTWKDNVIMKGGRVAVEG